MSLHGFGKMTRSGVGIPKLKMKNKKERAMTAHANSGGGYMH
jgi:hypothetical protein